MAKQQNNKITLTKEQKEHATAHLKSYLEETFDLEIGNLAAEFFLDHIAENIAPYYYNNAIADAFSFITEKAEDLYQLMKENP